MRRLGFICVSAYILTIFMANWSIATFGAIPVGLGLLAPAGVLFAGLALTLRDGVHSFLGGHWALLAILTGAGLSWWVSPQFAVASAIAFLFSELADYSVYAPLRERHWLAAILLSNSVGLVLDSMIFLWLAFGSFDFLAGQVLAKTYVTIAAIIVLAGLRRAVAPAAEGG